MPSSFRARLRVGWKPCGWEMNAVPLGHQSGTASGPATWRWQRHVASRGNTSDRPQRRRSVATTDFTEGTLLHEGEQEEFSSRRGDSSEPHKGQLLKVTRSRGRRLRDLSVFDHFATKASDFASRARLFCHVRTDGSVVGSVVFPARRRRYLAAKRQHSHHHHHVLVGNPCKTVLVTMISC